MDTANIKTRPDGSIDIDFYTKRARALRSQQAHKIAKDGHRKARRLPQLFSNIFGTARDNVVREA